MVAAILLTWSPDQNHVHVQVCDSFFLKAGGDLNQGLPLRVVLVVNCFIFLKSNLFALL